MVVVISALVLLALVGVIAVYNGLVRRRNAVDNAWAQVDVQLKRRHDLVPNLVETVRGYAGHERQTLSAVTAARTQAVSASTPAEQANAEHMLTGALRGLLAVVESYPDLKASRNFAELQEELATTENRIAYSRQYYNDAVLTYNNAIQTVPANLVAGLGGFASREYFQAPGEERGPARVRF
ncbi:LemA family protein [Nonomuraea cavernae]|nr:LemA family protein [Nonomuraea cavernae]MCA2185963.1 LemA family protein [Nonomuraea cavernae]